MLSSLAALAGLDCLLWYRTPRHQGEYSSDYVLGLCRFRPKRACMCSLDAAVFVSGIATMLLIDVEDDV